MRKRDENSPKRAQQDQVHGVTHGLPNDIVFVGHGRSGLWARLVFFLERDLGIRAETYETEPRAGQSIREVLEAMLDAASFAILVLTAEDENRPHPSPRLFRWLLAF